MTDFNVQSDSIYFIDTNIWLYSFYHMVAKENVFDRVAVG